MPGVSGFLRSRPSFGRTDRSLKERPMSVGPGTLSDFTSKRGSLKDSSLSAHAENEGAILAASVPEGQMSLPPTNIESTRPSEASSIGLQEVSSNSDNHSLQMDTSTFKTPDPPSGYVMGRNFDDESDDDLHIREELSNLSSLFDRASAVLNSPAKCGVFINYLFTQNRDVAPTLFYLVNQYFQRSLHVQKELAKDQKRLCIEIFSTFLHEKSPLRLDIPTPIVRTTLERIQAGAGVSTFKEAADAALNIVQSQLSKLAQEIRYGMDTWKPPQTVNLLIPRTREEELAIFELCLTPRLLALQQQITNSNYASGESLATQSDKLPLTSSGSFLASEDLAQALSTSLATTFQYFSVLGLGSNTSPDLVEALSSAGSSIRASLFARSVENLSASGVANVTGSVAGGLSIAGSGLWNKLPHFCAKLKQKSHGNPFSTRKVKYKGHTVHERAFEQLVDCWVCGQLLWGLGPQGLACSNCDLSVHNKCKLNIRETCTKDGRKSGLWNVTTLLNTNGTQPAFTRTNSVLVSPQHNRVADTVSDNPTVYRTWSSRRRHIRDRLHRPLDELVNSRRWLRSSANSLDSGATADSSSAAIAVLDQVITPNSASAEMTVFPLSESSPVAPTRSESRVSDIVGDGEASRRNKPFGDDQHSGTDVRLVSRMRNRFERAENEPITPPSRSDSLASTNSALVDHVLALDRAGDPSGSGASAAMDAVPELVTTNWSDDPEMIAGESFEAAVELRRQFPDYQMPAKGSKSEEYIRTLCLLEFHQKTQFMVRHLKQYDYLLLRRWPPEHHRLAQELCLDRIPILIRLFRSLVACIDATKTRQGYVGMAEAILAWLTDNSSANLKTRHNKIELIDGLKHMRILYFNLPMIANNIVKDLDKKTKSFKDEAKVWQKIYAHLVSLPQTIDDVCMPLVKRINSCQLHSSLDKKDAVFRQQNTTIAPFQDLLLNFPRMLFRFWVVAHDEVAVDKLTVTSANKVNHDYIRERTDMLVILLHNALMLLVKDNDRFLLRAFKATREHAGGGSGGGGSGGGGGGSSTAERTASVSSTLASTNSDRVSLIGTSHLSSASFSSANPSLHSPSLPIPTGSLGSASGAALYGTLTGAPLSPVNTGGLVNTVANMAGAGMHERTSGGGSNILKLAPILSLHNMFTSCGEKFGDEHLLNIITMDPTVLVRVLFYKEKQRQHWFTLLKELSSIAARPVASSQIQQQRSRYPIAGSRSVSPPQSLTPPSAHVEKPRELERVGEAESNLESTSDADSNINEPFLPDGDEKHTLERSRSIGSMGELMTSADRNIDLKCVHNLNDLVLLQVELTHKWLAYLSRTVALALQRRCGTADLSVSPTPQRLAGSSLFSGSEASLICTQKRRSVFSLGEEYQREQSEHEADQSVMNPAVRTKPADVGELLRIPLTASSPNLDQLDRQPGSMQRGRHALVTVHDHRRSQHRANRSSSVIDLKTGVDTVNKCRLGQISHLASQIVEAVNRFKVYGKLKRNVSELIMEDCLRHSQDAGVDVLPGEYADDKVLVFDNFQSAQVMLDVIWRSAKYFGMRFVVLKCKVLLQDCCDYIDLMLDNVVMELTEELQLSETLDRPIPLRSYGVLGESTDLEGPAAIINAPTFPSREPHADTLLPESRERSETLRPVVDQPVLDIQPVVDEPSNETAPTNSQFVSEQLLSTTLSDAVCSGDALCVVDSVRDSGCVPSTTDDDESTNEDHPDMIDHPPTPVEEADAQRTPTMTTISGDMAEVLLDMNVDETETIGAQSSADCQSELVGHTSEEDPQPVDPMLPDPPENHPGPNGQTSRLRRIRRRLRTGAIDLCTRRYHLTRSDMRCLRVATILTFEQSSYFDLLSYFCHVSILS
ncbi:uncharacterized protein DEA37_0009952 [Paragonimus westermani]|uniref:Phorbol-ester/DAG-type domain-containing protein n=1 Tax=Paragonimus westermani TaxID=34504 RepID=A0A5J4NSX4_9TREM|nr:uncharacterized protein DEA37_0009952 [Paragonimus westermani]